MVKEEKTRIGLEANYAVTRGGNTSHVGKRAVLRLGDLAPQVDVNELINAVPEDARLVFWVARPAGEDKHTLVSVGQGVEPLIALRLDAPAALAPLVPSGQQCSLDQQGSLKEPLGGPDSVAENVTLWVEAPAGDRWALPIGFIGHADTVTIAKSHFADVVLAVLAYRQSYRAILLIEFGGVGIPGNAICDSLRNSNDGLAQVIANAIGCPG